MDLPRVIYWREPIDGEMCALHARRAWDVPACAQFIIVPRHEYWQGEHRALLDARIKAHERSLYAYYGKLWKQNLDDADVPAAAVIGSPDYPRR